MTKTEYNKLLQEVQAIECQLGYQILEPYQCYDGDRLAEAGYAFQGRTVFRQTDPFTEHTQYFVDEGERGKIVYCDFSR